eukprot:gene28523-35371_t
MGLDFELKQLLYVPNIIDYARLLFLWISLQPGYNFAVWYAGSYLLDAFDGIAARQLNQCSKLGYYLDMVIDRISSCICLHVAAEAMINLGPQYAWTAPIFYALLVFVEVIAHGVVTYYAEVKGVHQKLMGHEYKVVQLYLGNKGVLFLACAGFE